MGRENCVFCGIVEGRVESSKILESERVVAFTSLDGGYPLIATKAHIRNWADPLLDEETVQELATTQRKLVQAVMATAEGVSLLSTNEEAAGQSEFHLHIHVMPRVVGDRLVRVEMGPRYNRTELNERAQLYRSKLVELGLV